MMDRAGKWGAMARATPETKYVAVGDADVAYQVVGDGPLDLLCVMGSWSNIAVIWEYPPMAELLTKLGSFCRLILLDRRGKGASDRLASNALPTWENWTEDIRAVLDAVGSTSAAILAEGEAGTIAILFAAM